MHITTPSSSCCVPDVWLSCSAPLHATSMWCVGCRQAPYLAYLLAAAAIAFATAVAYTLLRLEPPIVEGRAAIAIQPVLLGVCASIPATQTLLYAKCVSSMVVLTLGGDEQLSSWIFWVGAVVPPAAAALWMATLSHGLARFPSVIVVPCLQVGLCSCVAANAVPAYKRQCQPCPGCFHFAQKFALSGGERLPCPIRTGHQVGIPADAQSCFRMRVAPCDALWHDACGLMSQRAWAGGVHHHGPAQWRHLLPRVPRHERPVHIHVLRRHCGHAAGLWAEHLA